MRDKETVKKGYDPDPTLGSPVWGLCQALRKAAPNKYFTKRIQNSAEVQHPSKIEWSLKFKKFLWCQIPFCAVVIKIPDCSLCSIPCRLQVKLRIQHELDTWHMTSSHLINVQSCNFSFLVLICSKTAKYLLPIQKFWRQWQNYKDHVYR